MTKRQRGDADATSENERKLRAASKRERPFASIARAPCTISRSSWYAIDRESLELRNTRSLPSATTIPAEAAYEAAVRRYQRRVSPTASTHARSLPSCAASAAARNLRGGSSSGSPVRSKVPQSIATACRAARASAAPPPP